MEIIVNVLFLVVGFVMLIKGADKFVDGTSGIARRFGIPQLIIGLTIVAMGTSAPEAAVSISAAIKGNAGITIGNIVGSNILNTLIILGVTSIIVPLAVSKISLIIDIPFMIVISVILLLQGLDGTITFADGLLLVVLFACYLYYLFRAAKKNQEDVEAASITDSIARYILMAVIGLVLIVVGSDITVDAATNIAEYMGISDRIIGLTVVALGTSLPELVTSVAAARKGNADMAIGNIVGSNIFNILFVVGLSSLIIPISYAHEFIFDAMIAIISGLALLVLSVRNKTLGRWGGIILLCGYAAYFCAII